MEEKRCVCENCHWQHDGAKNNCWLEHEPSENCGDFEPMELETQN